MMSLFPERACLRRFVSVFRLKYVIIIAVPVFAFSKKRFKHSAPRNIIYIYLHRNTGWPLYNHEAVYFTFVDNILLCTYFSHKIVRNSYKLKFLLVSFIAPIAIVLFFLTFQRFYWWTPLGCNNNKKQNPKIVWFNPVGKKLIYRKTLPTFAIFSQTHFFVSIFKVMRSFLRSLIKLLCLSDFGNAQVSECATMIVHCS